MPLSSPPLPLTAARPQTAAAQRHVRVAYIMSRFPKLTETFVCLEIASLLQQGVDIEIFPLLRARNSAKHPEGASVLRKAVEMFCRPNRAAKMHMEAAALMGRARFLPFWSWGILWAQLFFLRHHPLRYLSVLACLVRQNAGSPNYFLASLAIFPKVVRMAYEMQSLAITHIHAHFANHPATAAFVIHRLTGIPYSFTAHGADLQVDQHMLREKVAGADTVVAISNYNRRFLLEKCGNAYADKVRVIHCGTDTQFFTPTDDPVRRPATAPFTLVCIGTMYEVKGHRYLLDACRILRDRGHDLRCYLVGDGPDRADLERQVQNDGLSKVVCFQGPLTRDEIAVLLRECDALVTPSIPTRCGRREGIPVVIMEGMASGLAVVASHLSGIPELVRDGIEGLLVRPADSEALARALERLMTSPSLRRRLGAAGRRRVLECFDLASNAARLAECFRGDEL